GQAVAAADVDRPRSESVARALAQVRVLSVDELVPDDTVELVLNLTIPAAHAEIALQALRAGKCVYGEKPPAATTADARHVLDQARAAGTGSDARQTRSWAQAFRTA